MGFCHIYLLIYLICHNSVSLGDLNQVFFQSHWTVEENWHQKQPNLALLFHFKVFLVLKNTKHKKTRGLTNRPVALGIMSPLSLSLSLCIILLSIKDHRKKVERKRIYPRRFIEIQLLGITSYFNLVEELLVTTVNLPNHLNLLKKRKNLPLHDISCR